ncbi:MAG: ExeM/NucH family extracellular endonuclease [Ideonella sp.]|nr:ExeM/NucH family extracellular endonuclease [Ideonella sp.]
MGCRRGLVRALVGWATLSLTLGLQARCEPPSAPPSLSPSGPEVLTLSQIQGAQDRSPWAGQWVRSAGVVTLVVPGGVYLQDPVGDGDPQTSDAAYLPLKAGHGWRAGQWWQLTARVEEWPMAGRAQNGPRPSRTVLTLPRDLALWAEGCAVQATLVELPLRPALQSGALEGMLVELAGPLTVGQVLNTSAGARLWLSAGPRERVATDQARPGPAAQQHAAQAAARRVDVSLDAETEWLKPHSLAKPRHWRGGQVLETLRGVRDSRAASTARGLRLIATQIALAVPDEGRPPPPPPPQRGQLRVAGVNLHNFFTSLGTAQADVLQDLDDVEPEACRQGHQQSWRWCRGAPDWASYQQQRDKLVDLLLALKADVVGVMEVQNNQGRALQALVEALNARVGETQWAAVAPSPDGAGQDAVAVGLLYRPARLHPVGSARNDTRAVHHRPPLAQIFRTAQGLELLVVVNHFKSRQCLRAKGADQDQQDGQGCFNHRRRLQAQALHRFVEDLQRQGAPQAALLLGDFNAHTHEAPLTELGDLGWQDVLSRHAPGVWSYVWAGQAGRLDHVLASPSLSLSLSAAGSWPVNSDEPPQSARRPGPWRASDHDPIWADLELPPSQQQR